MKRTFLLLTAALGLNGCALIDYDWAHYNPTTVARENYAKAGAFLLGAGANALANTDVSTSSVYSGGRRYDVTTSCVYANCDVSVRRR